MESTQPTAVDLEEAKQQLAEIVKLLKETQGKASISQYETVLSKLFAIVPELESIQKNARLKVLSKQAHRCATTST